MIRKCTLEDKKDWVRLNKLFIEYEYKDENIWSHGKVFFLDDFFIEESFRGRGYGEKALKSLQEYAKKGGIKRIQLMAENTNPKAIEFYKKHKFNEQEIHLFLKYLI